MSDQLQPQPLSDVPAPPPSEPALRSRAKMRWLIVIGGWSFTMLALLAIIAIPIFTRRGKPDPGPTYNAHQIGLALFAFEAQYGKFPDATTAAKVKLRCFTPLTLAGHSSNDYFAQMIAAGICQSESMFYAKAKGAVKPDNIMDTDASVLSHGECGFAYVSNLDATSILSAPILIGPVVPGTRALDKEAFGGKAVVMRLDHSVSSLPINSAGQAMYLNMDILDPKNPVWGGKAPEVKWPK